ncbi:hypothetical protein [uncultured Nostoc sp.]|uniref:hypothetical protein n=1 Tax=uncultured Nostoc sp. TaxID=340711 RepID=UPI0035CAF16B
MSWSNFSKIKASLVLVFIFGAFTFLLGLAFNKLPNSLSDRDKQLISFIGVPAITLGFLALVNSRMLEEIESDVKIKEMGLKIELNEKFKTDLVTEMQNFMEEYQE